MSKITEIHPDLRLTLELNEHIDEVYFTKAGAHFFNKYELFDERGKSTKKFYGWMKTQVKEIIVKDAQGKEKGVLKLVNIANPATEIVEILTRDEVLALPDMEIGEIQHREQERTNPAMANQLMRVRKAGRPRKEKAEA